MITVDYIVSIVCAGVALALAIGCGMMAICSIIAAILERYGR